MAAFSESRQAEAADITKVSVSEDESSGVDEMPPKFAKSIFGQWLLPAILGTKWATKAAA
jgi:hypothetical protein